MSRQKKYINKELSWLAFNKRVLEEAQNENRSIEDRIKFFSIYLSNLDEFYRIKVGALKKLKQIDKKNVKTHLGFNPKKTIRLINDEVREQYADLVNPTFSELIKELSNTGISIWNGEPFSKEQFSYLQNAFKSRILGHIHLTFNPEKKSGYSNVADAPILLAKVKSNDKIAYATVNIPSDKIQRFFKLPSQEGHHYIFLDDIIKFHIASIFPKHEVLEAFSYRVNHDESLSIEDEYSGNLIEKISSQLINSQAGLTTRLIYDQDMSEESLRFLMRLYGVAKTDVISNGKYQDLFDLNRLPLPKQKKKNTNHLKPLLNFPVDDSKSIFTAIDNGDKLLYLPYQCFDYVLRFFNEAAIDPDVTQIRVTLYRIAKNSQIAHALINAARNGKRIIVFIEVKASTDEAHNLYWAKEMEKVGIILIYSLPGLKVHAKMALVHKKVDGIEKGYAYLSTGNFNESTAKIYSDIGFFTSSKKLIGELCYVFDFLYYKKNITNLRHLLVSQVNMVQKFVKLIDKEIEAVKSGSSGEVIIKLNNLEDRVMIDKLYEASNAGVKVILLIRAINCLNPKINNENIQVIRIIDDFLEHARITIFNSSGKQKIYLSSADWMQRNLYKRLEIAFPIYKASLKKEILSYIDLQIKEASESNKKASKAIAKNRGSQRNIYEWLKSGSEPLLINQ